MLKKKSRVTNLFKVRLVIYIMEYSPRRHVLKKKRKRPTCMCYAFSQRSLQAKITLNT